MTSPLTLAGYRGAPIDQDSLICRPKSVAKPWRPITGKRYGRLVALRENGYLGDEAVWRYRCDCGAELDRIAWLVRRAWAKGCRPSCLSCAHKGPRPFFLSRSGHPSIAEGSHVAGRVR